MIQICCLTVAPALLAAGIYLTLSRIVTTFGRENSRIPGRWYPGIFIPCDILALALQSAGGGIASNADDDEAAANLGKNIMIAGLVAQVVTMAIFILFAVDFAIRTWRRNRTLGDDALDPRYAHLRSSSLFRGFLIALSISTLGIFTRCVFRVAELSDGWDGSLLSNESLFIALEGVMIVISVLVLNLFHPGVCFKEGYEEDVSTEMKGTKPKDGGRWRLFKSKESKERAANTMGA